MSESEIIDRFQKYCFLNETVSEPMKNEQIVLGNFVRKDFLNLLTGQENGSELINYIETTFSLSEAGKVELNIPFLLVEDLIEMGAYSTLEHLLNYLDAKSKLWVSKLSSKKGVGLILLRSVNLLRRKIVRSEHSKLAGLSLLLLTKIFPASERSGINLKGERNIDNKNLKAPTTVYEHHYSHFCTLHKLFYTSPLKLFEYGNWKLLIHSIDGLLVKFEEILQKESFSAETFPNTQEFFSVQHLFTEKSFELQLNDQCFRLSSLGQILVLLQDVNCFSVESIRDKATVKIEDIQEAWIGDTTKKVFYLISLHKFGKEYFRFLRSIFRNEKNWINWKNNSCPSYEKYSTELTLNSITFNNSASIDSNSMGNEELSRLWNYSLEDINNRKLKPEIESYLENVKPKEEDDDYVDPNLVWRASRLNWKAII